MYWIEKTDHRKRGTLLSWKRCQQETDTLSKEKTEQVLSPLFFSTFFHRKDPAFFCFGEGREEGTDWLQLLVIVQYMASIGNWLGPVTGYTDTHSYFTQQKNQLDMFTKELANHNRANFPLHQKNYGTLMGLQLVLPQLDKGKSRELFTFRTMPQLILYLGQYSI